MNLAHQLLFSCALVAACSAAAIAQPRRFQQFEGVTASAMSADGSTLVGTVISSGGFGGFGGGEPSPEAYGVVAFADGTWRRLTAQFGRVQSTAQAVSPDGRYVVGCKGRDSRPSPPGCTSWDLTRDDPQAPSSPLTIVYPPHIDYFQSVGQGVSADGSIVVGRLHSSAVMWIGVSNPVVLTPGANSEARAVSADGSRVVGYMIDGEDPIARAFAWTQAGGIQLLPKAFESPSFDVACSISADGLTIAGYSAGWLTRWTIDPDTGAAEVTAIGVSAGESGDPSASISPDGQMIGGVVNGEAVVWTQDAGVVSIGALALQAGVDLGAQGVEPFDVVGISADHRHFAGNAGWGGWLLDLTPRCPADWNDDGVPSSQDVFDFITGFFSDNADFNNDGQTTSQDFFDFLAAFFAGC